MRRLVFLAVMAGVFGFSAIAHADVVPRGSYQSTCSDFYTDGNTLGATCRTKYGDNVDTSLRNYNDCDGDIANSNGRLVCVDADDDDQDGGWTPRGSYRDTCRRINVEARTLEAECQDRYGRWRYTELDNFQSCRGDIYNQNGILGCNFDDADDDDHDGGVSLPGGNWRHSCRNARLYGKILYAQCREPNGGWHEMSIDLRRCSGAISYWHGRLVCAPGGYEPARITLFKYPNYAGKSRTYSTDIANLNVDAFGNQASSVVIQGGVWQICDQPYYRGFCVVLDRTAPNLAAYRFDDRAESVRRLR